MRQHVPNYKLIFGDIITQKFPHKETVCKNILSKDILSALDILELNKKIFGLSKMDGEVLNCKHRSYSKSDIFKILDYQKKNRLTNSELVHHFSLSRNSVTKWRKLYI